MPLARWRVYEGGPQIWLAPTADDSDGWLASMRHIAIEAGRLRGQRAPVHPGGRLPRRLPARRSPRASSVLGRGGACIVSPDGEVIAGPLYDAEGIVVADCDLREALRAKRYFDVAGHYSRRELLAPTPPSPA